MKETSERPPHAVCVYLMTAADHVKIGIAKDPNWRRTMLQSACPFEVRLVEASAFQTLSAARAVEKEFHQDFADFRVYGEWFNIPLAWAQNALQQKAHLAIWRGSSFPRSRRRTTQSERLELVAAE